MDYRIEEYCDGPFITPNDWVAEEGSLDSGGGCLEVFAYERATVNHIKYPVRGGGDVELTVSFNFDDFGADSSFLLHFYSHPKGPEVARGFKLHFNNQILTVYLGDEKIGEHPHRGTARDTLHTVRLATFSHWYAVWYDTECIVSGEGEFPFPHNEGNTRLYAENCTVRMHTYQEALINANVPIPEWRRLECLYEEPFGERSAADNWFCNQSGPETGMEVHPDSFIFRRMSNSFINRKFSQPIAVDFLATPVENPEYSALVTDAIFIWLAEEENIGLANFVDQLNQEQRASLKDLMEVGFYWVDFGGTNNVTTRLRKNPGRQMMRQFSDPPRLLERNRSYNITVAQNENIVEFWVDGYPLIRQYDPEPYSEGHVGFRAFIADLKIQNLKIWQIG